MATQTTDAPLSSTTPKTRAGSDNIEAEAIGLEVPVRISGTQVTAVVMGTTEHAEPFEEDTSTMIVFPRGAMVKLLARVRTGQSVELTNLRANTKVPCKIVQVNRPNNIVHYIKLEFAQAFPGFWGVHFPSDPPLPTRKQESASPTASSYSASPSFVDSVSVPPPSSPKQSSAPAHSAPIAAEQNPAPPATPISTSSASERDIFSHAAVPLRPSAPLLNENPAPASPSAYASPSELPVVPRTEPEDDEIGFPASIVPATPSRESLKPDITTEIPDPKKAPGYGLARNWQKEQIEPLAGPSSSSAVETAISALTEVPAPTAEKIPVPGRRPQLAPPAAPKIESKRQKPVRPVFGELHTFSAAVSRDASFASSAATLNLSSVARSASAPARSRPRLLSVLVTLCVLTVIAAGVMFVRRHPSLFANTGAAAPADNSAQAAIPTSDLPASNPPQTATPTPSPSSPVTAPDIPSFSSPVSTPSESKSAATKSISPAPSNAVPTKSSNAIAETNAVPKTSVTESHKESSGKSFNLYAGDLNARPEAKRHPAKQMEAQAPDITATAPDGVAAATDAAPLSSIVPGSDSVLSAPTAPAAPETATRQGGDVQSPKLLSSVAPVYPPLAKQSNVEGDVVIQAEIGISGIVTSMKVVSGPVLLRSAAMDALRKWRYAPAKLDGRPISTHYEVTIRFRLRQ